MPDPVTAFLGVLIVVGVPVSVLVWAARERGQSRWFGALGLFSYFGLLLGMLIIDGRHRPIERE